MSQSKRMMSLGLLLHGAGSHVAGWRMPGARSDSEDFSNFLRTAQAAERAKLDFVFVADAPFTQADLQPGTIVRLEPITLLSAIAVHTTHIGLVGTASTTYSEPFNVARQFASLDHISGGRAGWNVVTGAQPAAAANFGNTPHPPRDERYAIAAEYVDVVKGLWDSWEDGAIVRDVAAGVYADTTKMHAIKHQGKYFSVAGPLNVTRSPQGYPIIAQAGASDTGRAFAASVGEVIFAAQQDLDTAKKFADGLRQEAEKAGRDRSQLKILPGVCPIVGTCYEDAMAKLSQLGSLLDPIAALRVLSDRLGHDLSKYPLDGPVPDLPPSEMMQGHATALSQLARDRRMTLRELRDYTACARGHRLLLGTPEDVADGLEEWFAADACDGFNIVTPWCPGSLDDFSNEVVPILQKRGLFRTEYSGRTLRDHLGLARPPHPLDAGKSRSSSAT
jgi:FMN-dependent oxidoreductase (nitrilotriacetate monooxygenase family)